MSRERQILTGVLGVVLIAAAAGEHVYRRIIERRYQRSVDRQRQLELQFGEVLSSHQQLQSQLEHERQRSHELSEALASSRAHLEQAVGRLSQETQGVRELRMRLAALQQQMDQLQGELAIALQEEPPTHGKRPESAPVQLERVVVSPAGTNGPQGRVLSVHRDWDFVVVDLGWDAVRLGDTISIFHNDHLLAKARVERVQEGVSAATVLPEWKGAEIQVNDLVRAL